MSSPVVAKFTVEHLPPKSSRIIEIDGQKYRVTYEKQIDGEWEEQNIPDSITQKRVQTVIQGVYDKATTPLKEAFKNARPKKDNIYIEFSKKHKFKQINLTRPAKPTQTYKVYKTAKGTDSVFEEALNKNKPTKAAKVKLDRLAKDLAGGSESTLTHTKSTLTRTPSFTEDDTLNPDFSETDPTTASTNEDFHFSPVTDPTSTGGSTPTGTDIEDISFTSPTPPPSLDSSDTDTPPDAPTLTSSSDNGTKNTSTPNPRYRRQRKNETPGSSQIKSIDLRNALSQGRPFGFESDRNVIAEALAGLKHHASPISTTTHSSELLTPTSTGSNSNPFSFSSVDAPTYPSSRVSSDNQESSFSFATGTTITPVTSLTSNGSSSFSFSSSSSNSSSANDKSTSSTRTGITAPSSPTTTTTTTTTTSTASSSNTSLDSNFTSVQNRVRNLQKNFPSILTPPPTSPKKKVIQRSSRSGKSTLSSFPSTSPVKTKRGPNHPPSSKAPPTKPTLIPLEGNNGIFSYGGMPTTKPSLRQSKDLNKPNTQALATSTSSATKGLLPTTSLPRSPQLITPTRPPSPFLFTPPSSTTTSSSSTSLVKENPKTLPVKKRENHNKLTNEKAVDYFFEKIKKTKNGTIEQHSVKKYLEKLKKRNKPAFNALYDTYWETFSRHSTGEMPSTDSVEKISQMSSPEMCETLRSANDSLKEKVKENLSGY